MQTKTKKLPNPAKKSLYGNDKDIRYNLIPFRTTFIYAIIGCLWILFSDKLLEAFFSDLKTISMLQTFKGWLYVFATAALIFAMVQRDIRKMDHINRTLQQGNKVLEDTKNELNNQLDKVNKSEELLRVTEERYRLALEGSNDGIWDWDLEQDQIFFSSRFNETLGYTPEQVGSDIQNWLGFVKDEDVNIVKGAISECLTGVSDQIYCKFRINTNDGDTRWVLCRGKVVRNTESTPVRMAGSLTNISSQVQADEKIRSLAYYDTLTGLPNREYFMEFLDVEINKAILSEEKHISDSSLGFSILYLDVDNFKTINDTYGHSFGDKIIIELGKRFQSILFEGDFISRFSGDEFMIYLNKNSDRASVSFFIETLRRLLDQPIRFEDFEFSFTVSIGIAMFPKDGEDVYTLVRNADTAMYEAKGKGKNDYKFYNPEMNIKIAERLEIESNLRQAINNNRFLLHYQPQICSRTGKIIGLEALIRWKDPEKGLIPPFKFIPIAEESGLIIPIGDWVLNTACSYSNVLNNTFNKDISMAVNISTLQFKSNDLLKTIIKTIESTKIKPHQLEIEITESTAIMDIDYTIRLMKKLKEMGVRISIDDFGTGYSSLNYLKMLPIDGLKMDMSFVHDITVDKKVQAIAKTILNLAHDLNLVVTAEGVETEEQYLWLKDQRCDIIQGYYFSKPLPEKEIESFIINSKRN